jgi:class 3 adenylate cyclase/tetratricopeptide (TPR) repeat protein
MADAARSVEDLRPYVPQLLSAWQPTHGDPRHMRVDGSLVFVDISGFTKLTERLARKGKVGAEEMSDLLSSTFSALLDVSRLEGADLLKWGGDAVLLLFRGIDHAVRACRAAGDMRTTLRTVGRLTTTEGTVTLKMSVGVHSGSFDCYLVGDPEVHQELLVAGPGVSTTAVMEQTASAGEVLVSPQTAALLPPGSCREGPEPGTHLLHARRLLGPAGTVERRVSSERRGDATTLAGFIPPVLRRQLLATPGEPEHRTVAVAFVQFAGTDALTEAAGAAAVAEALDQCVRTVQRATEDHGVTFFETDLDKDGGKIMLVAGAPRSNGHDEERMLRTARQIMDGMAGLAEMTGHALPLRIGINRGNVFAGRFGPDFRRTFSIKGDAVNLAARVMGKAAHGEILATAAVLERSATQFETELLPPFLVKGKSMPIHAAKVGAVRGLRTDRRTETPFVGRETELAALHAALSRAREGSGRLLEMVGEPGIGKSRLVEQVLAEEAGRDDVPSVPVHFASCGEYESSTAYYPFRRLLREVLGLARDASAEDTSRRLAEVVTETAPHLGVWLPLLGIPFGLDLPDTQETRELDEQFRKGRLEELVVELLDACVTSPTVLLIEDVHFMDDASCDLLDRLVRDIATRPLLLVVVRRDLAAGYVPRAGEHLVTVRPAPLDPETSLQLIQAATGDRALTRDAMDALRGRGGGNPMFLEALCTSLGTEGTVDDLPESVEGLMTSQIDRLDPVDRTVLRYAAVLGFVVEDDDLQDLLTAQLGSGPDSHLDQRLPLLDEFLTRASPGRLRFRHALMRDVAYEGLPYRRRQVLHDQVGLRIEASSTDPREQSELLSLHFFQAGRFDRAWRYARVAGMRARSKYANTEAVVFFTRAADAARRTPDVPPHDLAEVLESLGDLRFVGGSPEAWGAYRQARRLWADDKVRVAGIMLKEARIEERDGKLAHALRRLSRGLALLSDVPGPEAAAARSMLANRYAFCRNKQGRYTDALRWGAVSVEAAQDSTDMLALATSYRAMQGIHLLSGVPEDLPYGQLALHAFEELGDLGAQAACLNNLAVRAFFEGRWTESLAMYHRAADNFERIGDVANFGTTSYNVADVLIGQARYADAEPLLNKALMAARATGDEELVALVVRERGKSWSRGGRFEDGYALLTEARTRFEQLGEAPEVVDVDAAIAENLMLRGERDAAVELAEGTMPRAVEASARMILPTLHRIVGLCHLHEGRLPEARTSLMVALELSADGELRREHVHVMLGLAELARVEGDPRADELMRESSDALRELGVVTESQAAGTSVVDVRVPEQYRLQDPLPA